MFVPNYTRDQFPKMEQIRQLPESMQKIVGKTLKVANFEGNCKIRLTVGPDAALISIVGDTMYSTLSIKNGSPIEFKKGQYVVIEEDGVVEEGLVFDPVNKLITQRFFDTMKTSLESAKIEGNTITLSGIEAYLINNN